MIPFNFYIKCGRNLHSAVNVCTFMCVGSVGFSLNRCYLFT